MKGILKIIFLLASSLVLFFGFCSHAEVTLTTLVTFDTTNGDLPVNGLVLGRDGNFYGILSYGGWYNDGTIYRMTPDGGCVILVTFDGSNGSHPSSLIQGKDGNFYGTTLEGGSDGNGSIFKMNPDGQITTIAAVKGLYYGPGELVQGKDGNLYGKMSQFVGTTTFEVTLGSKLIIPATSGIPAGSDGLLKGKDGNFYGTMFSDTRNVRDRYVFGSVFRVNHQGITNTLVVFNQTNGANPLPKLTQGRDGNIYGVTLYGGAFHQGTIFRLNLKQSPISQMPMQPYKINVPILIHAISNKVDPRILAEMQAPIEFYGKVVNENGNPVAGANVSFQWNDLMARGFENSATAESDSKGRFSLQGKQGGSLTVSVSKNGYYAYHRGAETFQYAKIGGGQRISPDPKNPFIFHLRKKGQGVELITSEHGMQLKVDADVPRDNTPRWVDFFQKQTSPTGQLEIRQIKPPWQSATNWSFSLSIPDGGLVENEDQFQFEAPESGYLPTVEYDFEKGNTNWMTQVTKQFYIELGQPRRYGWLRIESNLAQETVFLTYAINPTSSRYLEPKSSNP